MMRISSYSSSLGEAEWENYGGSIRKQRHPSGRISVRYIAPDGSTLRSWRKCKEHIQQRSKYRQAGCHEFRDNQVERFSRKEVPQGPSSASPKSPKRKARLHIELSSDSEISEKKIYSRASRAGGTAESKEQRDRTNASKNSTQRKFKHESKLASSPYEKGAKFVEHRDGREYLVIHPSISEKNPRKRKPTSSANCSDLKTKIDSTTSSDNKSNKTANDSLGDSPGNLKKAKTSLSERRNALSALPDTSSGSDGVNEMIDQKLLGPKRAAEGTSLKENEVKLDVLIADIRAKRELEALDETAMLMMTRPSTESDTPERRIASFSLYDGEGNLLHVEDIPHKVIYLAGLCTSREAVDKDRAVRCERIGPLIAWSIMGYEKDCVEIVLTSPYADYICDMPSPNSRENFNALYDRARVCREVYRALSRPDGGDPTMSLAALEFKLVRLHSNLGRSGQFFSKEYFHNIGAFVVKQLYALDEHAVDGCQVFSGLQALEDILNRSSERRRNHDTAEA